MVLSQILMAVGSLYALCFALMAGRLPRFQKHPYLWGTAVALVIFFIIEPLFNVLAMVVFGVPISFFLIIDSTASWQRSKSWKSFFSAGMT